MTIFVCENADCEEHHVAGTDEEWVGFKQKLGLECGYFFLIISKDCPCDILSGYEVFDSTKNLLAVRRKA